MDIDQELEKPKTKFIIVTTILKKAPRNLPCIINPRILKNTKNIANAIIYPLWEMCGIIGSTIITLPPSFAYHNDSKPNRY